MHSPSIATTELAPAPSPHGVAWFARAARIIHPFPTLLNVVATAALAFVAARADPPAGVLTRMLIVMLCAQSAIGITNDIFDRELDAATKPWKPIAAGLVAPTAARVLALMLITVSLALAATLGAGGFALAAVGLACGLAYDVRLKRTPLSAVPYMIAIPVLPLWVWLTLGAWDGVLWWLLPLGGLIGLALHLANTVPDIEADRAAGVNGLAHRLGTARSMYVGWASFGAALVLAVALAAVVDYRLALLVPAVIAGAALLVSSVTWYIIRRDESALQFGFGALSVGAAILAVGWLGAVA